MSSEVIEIDQSSKIQNAVDDINIQTDRINAIGCLMIQMHSGSIEGSVAASIGGLLGDLARQIDGAAEVLK